jgi:2-aminoethylphosphonate-pyruvate transaminase
MKLLNPGPVTLTERVRAALARPDLCHREPEFATLQTRIRTGLVNVYAEAADGYAAVLLTGSGTAAVEAMVGSLVPHDGRALVVANGVYGERMAAMLAAHGKAHELVKADWTAPMDLPAVEAALVRGGFTHVLAVHHETTTGRLNDLAALGTLCRAHGVPLLLDTVSSFGAEAIDFAGWNVEAVAGTANKCLHGVPGVSFVLAREAVFAQRRSGSRSLYLDLFKAYELQRQGSSPFTQAVHACYALDEALQELADAGGWQARRTSYRERTRLVREALLARGCGLLLPALADHSCVLTSYRLPEGVGYEALHDGLKAAGFVIYAGQGHFEGGIFRISTMGELHAADLERLVAAFDALLPVPA